MIIVLLILIFIGIFGFSALASALVKIEKKIDEFTPQVINENSFIKGVQEANLMVKCSLFKMWKENKLLDFESIDSEIGSNVNFLVKNPDILIKIRNELADFNKNNQLLHGDES